MNECRNVLLGLGKVDKKCVCDHIDDMQVAIVSCRVVYSAHSLVTTNVGFVMMPSTQCDRIILQSQSIHSHDNLSFGPGKIHIRSVDTVRPIRALYCVVHAMLCRITSSSREYGVARKSVSMYTVVLGGVLVLYSLHGRRISLEYDPTGGSESYGSTVKSVTQEDVTQKLATAVPLSSLFIHWS